MTPAIFGFAGLALSADEGAFFRDADPAGYIIFGRNVASRDQLRGLTDDLRALQGRDRTFICIDQEGGRVARMKPPEWIAFPPGGAFDALYDLAPPARSRRRGPMPRRWASTLPKSASRSIAIRCSTSASPAPTT